MVTRRQTLQGSDLQKQNAIEMKWIPSKDIRMAPKRSKGIKMLLPEQGASGTTRLLPTPHQLPAPGVQFLLLGLFRF